MSVHIRKATPRDAEIIHAFIVALARFEREPDAVEVTAETLRGQLGADDPPFECLIAEVGGRPAGFALFYRTYSTWRGLPGMHLEDLYVDERHRRSGVARALFAALARIVVDRGWGRLEWSVLDWNAGAVAFYRALGGDLLDEWLPYRLDAAEISRLAARAAAP
jgi:GNAT superfamily N-acetyltransferase